mmetsp:Transcript_40054/g.95670  ORF Transcript_40054/g.95670 Transcript_40054/m.95670 type:complete len:262 (+) Transcript_40054:309-1094(+)
MSATHVAGLLLRFTCTLLGAASCQPTVSRDNLVWKGTRILAPVRFEFVVAVLGIEALSLVHTEIKVCLLRLFQCRMVNAARSHRLLITGRRIRRCFHGDFQLGFGCFQLCLRDSQLPSIQVPQVGCLVSLEGNIVQPFHVANLLCAIQPLFEGNLVHCRLQSLILDEASEFCCQLFIDQATLLQVRDNIFRLESVIILAPTGHDLKQCLALIHGRCLAVVHGFQPCCKILSSVQDCLWAGAGCRRSQSRRRLLRSRGFHFL